MDDAPQQISHDIARARRIADGLTDEASRRVLRAYVAELEARLARAARRDVAA